MVTVYVECLDHLLRTARLIKGLGLISMIDTRLVLDESEESTLGEAVAGMILNGLGFAKRPLSLTPQFFLPTNRSIGCFVPGSERRCAIAFSWAGRSLKAMPMGVIDAFDIDRTSTYDAIIGMIQKSLN